MMVLIEPMLQLTHHIFFFNDTATTEIYTLSLHDALPIWAPRASAAPNRRSVPRARTSARSHGGAVCTSSQHLDPRSEEHTSELQSRLHLVCRLLLEKKKYTLYLHDICSYSAPLRSTPVLV